MQLEEFDLIPIPLLNTQKNQYLIDYLLLKIQGSSFDAVFEEMMSNLEKNIELVPKNIQRIISALTLLHGADKFEKKMRETLELLVRRKSKIPEAIVKEWDLEFYGEDMGVTAIILLVCAIIGAIAASIVIYEFCVKTITTYGSSDVIKRVDTACRCEEREGPEIEYEIPVEYQCTQYYDENMNFLREECDEPEPPDDLEITIETDEIVWGEPIYTSE